MTKKDQFYNIACAVKQDKFFFSKVNIWTLFLFEQLFA